MKKFLRLTAALMAVFAMTNFIACSDGGSSSDDDLTITAESDVKEVEVGKTIELTVVGTDADVTWTSSDTAIATVADGTVTGVKAGEVTITAKAPDGKTGTIKITVKAASSSGDSGSTGGSGSGDSGSTGGSGSGDSGSTGGSGSGDSGSTGGTGEYKVVYNGEPIDEGTYTLEEAKALANKYELAEGTDYTIDEANKKIVLTDSGMAKVEAAMGGSGGGSGETPVAGEYKVVYEGVAVMEGLTLEAANAMATEIGLVENTDYTINNETKTITLTASGMAKVEAAESGNPGAGTDPSDPGAGDEPSAPGVTANAKWDFSTSPAGFPENDAAADAITDFAIAAGEGSGATLTATGRWKFNSGLQAQATSAVSVADVNADTWLGAADKAKYLTLNLESSATVTVVFCGAGGADAKRFVGLLDSSNAVIWSEGSLDSTTPVTKTVELSAGVYKIAANGSRINSISCE